MTSNARSFQVPGEQLEPSNGPVVVLWDIENCQVPSDVRPEDVAGNIRMALRSHPVTKGAVTMFSAYGDFTIFSQRIRKGCQRTGIKLVDVPNGRKDAADMAIVVDMFLFALDSPPPSTIMLISGDIDFAQALHVLGQRGYTIALVTPTGRTVSPALSNAARFIWDWSSVVHGIGFISSEASTANAINFNRDTFTLQDEKATASHYKSEQSGYGNYKQLMEDISDVPNCSSKYGGIIIAASSFPIFRCYSSLTSSIGASGKVSKHDALKDQPLVAQGLKGLLQRSLSSMRVKPEYHKIIQWLLCAINFGACKFAILFKLMKDVANSVRKGNLLLRAHFDKPGKADKKMGRGEMKDKKVLSDSVSLLDTVGCLDDHMAVRCSPRTDLLASGIQHASNQINNTTHFCANCFTRQMPQEIKSTHSTGCESKKCDGNGEEVVEKQKLEKKLKTSVLWKIKDGQTASDLVVDKKSNTRTENEIRTREITSQTCAQLQHGEGSTSDMEVNSLQSEKHHVFRNVYNGTEVCNLPKLGNEYGNIDKVQGFSTVAAIGHIISPDTSLPNNLTTAKQMPSIELKSNVSIESESGVSLESIGWCEICSVDCKSKVVLDQHKQGKKHKNKLLKIEEATRGPNAIDLVELKTDNLACSEEILMEIRSAGSFVFEAGVDVGSLTIDVLQGSNTVDASVGPIISPDANLPNNMTTDKEMPSIELKSNVSLESELGGNLESIGWCEICSVDCKSKVILDQHKVGKKHKNKLLKLDEANRGPNAIGFIELKTDNLNCSKEMVMETGSKGSFVFEAGVDAGFLLIDKLQGSSTVDTSVGPIISPDANLSNNMTTDKEMPSIELKSNVSLESELGGNLESIGWCEICSVDCKSKVVLDQHKQGKKHKNKLLKLDQANRGPNANGFIELKTDNLTCNKDMLMETRSAGRFVFEAGVDVGTKTSMSNNAIQSALCKVLDIDIKSEEVLGSYSLSNEKENFEKNLKNDKGDPAVDASPSLCDNMKSGVKTSMEVVSSNISSVITEEEKETTEGLKNAKGNPAVGVIPSMCDNMKSGVKTSIDVFSRKISSVTTAGEMETTEGLKNAKGDPAVGTFPSMCDMKSGMKTSKEVVSGYISSVTKVEEKETTEGLKNAKGDPAVGASPAMCDKMKIGMETSMEVVRSNIFLVTKVEKKETTEHLTWCNVCGINCFSEMVLTCHLLGKKHKKKLEKMQKVNNVSSVHLQGPNAIDLIEPKTDNLACSKEMPMETRSAESFVFEAGVDVGSLTIDVLQGSSTVDASVGPIIFPGANLPNNLTTAKEMPSMELKSNVSLESELGGNLGSIGWCEICSVDCKSKVILDQHKLGKKHKNKLLKLDEANHCPNAIGFISKEMVMETGSEGSFVFEAGVDAGFLLIDKLQGSSTVDTSVDPIISPDVNLPNNLTTSNEMPLNELKSDVSLESELGANLEIIGWCEICSVDCKSKVVLDQHKQGKKHKNKLLNLDEANRGPNANGFIELKTDNLTCTKDMLMETRSAGRFVFEAGVDVVTKTSMSDNAIQSSLCKVLGIDKSEEVLGSYSLSNEKENFEKNLKNDKGDPAVDASPSICDNMKSGVKTSMKVVSSNFSSVTAEEEKETTEGLKNAKGDPAVGASPAMCDKMKI